MWVKKGHEITANHSPGANMKGSDFGAGTRASADALCSTFPFL